jgi:hypothetical protein
MHNGRTERAVPPASKMRMKLGLHAAALPMLMAGMLTVGCGPKSESTESKAKSASLGDAGTSTTPAAKVEFTGSLRGIVKLATGALLPLATTPTPGKTDTVIAPGCPEIGEADRKPVSESAATGGLFPLHVAITEMTASPQRAPVTHELEIRDCRLWPGMIAAMTGDKLRLTNKSKAPFLPVLPRESFMQAVLPDAHRETTISGIGPMVIRCGFASYCGESVLVSTAHSLYAVTDAEGRFTISGVPLDQELKVHAWHPLFKPATVTIKLSRAERSKDVELAIEPLPTPPEAAPETKPTAAEPKKSREPKKPAPTAP